MKDAPPAGVYVAGGLALGAAAAVAYWQHYNDNVAAPPRLWLADGPLRERVLPHCSALLRPFAPTPWAANRHAQTVLGSLRTLTMRNRYNRQLILTVDGATLGLDWFDGCDGADFPAPPSAPVLLVCHGINGGSHEGYAKWVCAAALARGWRAAVLNYRGCNGLPFTAPRGYAATMSHDVFTAVYSVKARYPSAPLVAVGYSLGGLKLTKYVAEADAGLHPPPPGRPPLFSGSGLAAAAVVSSPVSLGLSAARLSDPTSLSFLYNLAVAYKMREHIAQHRQDITARSRFDVEAALAAWTVAGIEERGLPASLGFADRQQYYEASSSLDYIPAITTPTLILLAEDDPFLGLIPDVECSRNPSTLLALTRRGGHVAFLQGAWPLGKSYMDDAVMEFFGATLEHLHGINTHQQQQQQGPQGPEQQQQGQQQQGQQQGVGKAGGGGGGGAAAAPEEAARAEAWPVTDAARAGVRAAARAAAGPGAVAGRPPCEERCCGGGGRDDGHEHQHCAGDGPAMAAGRTGAGDGGGHAHAGAQAAVGGVGGQLRLLVQLQQQLEQRRRERAAAAAAAEAGAPAAAPRSRL
ncbi:hypothetical protein PLESTB_000444500 [Pleodorina starrii]|uniref:AB hydrolase-1 domain-containing protein n=1 Tax=Pleodorina starrii TaxID=330485 RepID=A0A9W6BF51_9CHLO|nr:hypothetical protein PLESTM_000676300 [Pleodorina starrii]GLC50898.1 hypothetical protein PLESTB_000444500 [Pleodorina starrii]GLC73909.1 hypothetical protein PLESTF_001436200 [Pleodorina starrii]